MVIKSFLGILVFALAFSAGAVTTGESSADEGKQKAQSQKSETQKAEQGSMQTRPESAALIDASQLHKASDVIGKTVENAQGEELGEIADLAIDADGRIGYAVLSFGGFLGMGDKYFAVPWDELQPIARGERTAFVLDVDKEKLRSAPGFDKGNWPDMASEEWRSKVDTFYKQGERKEKAQ